MSYNDENDELEMVGNCEEDAGIDRTQVPSELHGAMIIRVDADVFTDEEVEATMRYGLMNSDGILFMSIH